MDLEKRVGLLRSSQILNSDTLKRYYGQKRFEQVAESNALEGSTMGAGETELAIMKGVTLTGHDPAYLRDAVALDSALNRAIDIARSRESALDIDSTLEIHGLLLGDRPEAGRLRNVPVRISGAAHTPPKTLHEVHEQMLAWQEWSREKASLPAPIRAPLLHAWLTHIHPFCDGNGRTARAITTLELVRGGYPPIIIKKSDKSRYISALADSDAGGDIGPFFDMFLEKMDGALIGLEQSARESQGYNPVAERIRQLQERQAKIWTSSVQLLADLVEHRLAGNVAAVGGTVSLRRYYESFDADNFVNLATRNSAQAGWAFSLTVQAPGVPRQELLAFFGHRSIPMFHKLGDQAGVSLFWSKASAGGLRKWQRYDESPFGVEMTTQLGEGDDWYVRYANDKIRRFGTAKLADMIANKFF
ncbi:Fic family protein [Luteimonas fraxinea]|uniref:Fic family protein n=1 Tax=Luteimonas fraxinea TaxID=2901869 RepID=UPI001E36749F|nr:Fic family protein [Luteimonas fraxinea]MCD9126881.1 Fic family protein [Luteimonas fraxinea]